MFKTRSRLLIALVLFGVLGAAVGAAQADLVKLGDPPSDRIGRSAYLPGATPDAGEPDKPETGPPPRMSMTPGGRASKPVVQADTRTVVLLAETFRWTWVIWLARYLNQTP